MNGKSTILAVDDTSESLALLVKILTSAGYHVLPADSGELALSAIAANLPDLILLDVRMKGMDGLEVCRRLKAREETRHIPIILISAFAEVSEWVEGLQLGAADYITKPFRSEELLTRVKTYLSLNQANISLEQQAAALRQTNEQLQSEIAAHKQTEEDLKEANKRLEEQLGEIKILQDYLREQAIRDPLTGLYNRLYLYTTMERELARAKREDSPISVMMIDIDHFKNFNDTHGHQAGDEVLIALGGLLRNGTRQGDIACRYGGEEFIIIMPGVNEANTERRAEAMRHDFSNLCINYGEVELSATVSIGVSFYPQHGNSMNEIVKAADAALYEAKQAGRNRVHVWKNV